MSEPWTLTVAEAGRQIAARALSPTELVQSCLDRIARVDGRLKATAQIDGDGALSAARAAERDIAQGRYRGPLHGIPLALKDLIDAQGMATTGNSHVTDRSPAAADAFAVAKLRAAGAIILGKLNTDEFALGAANGDQPHPPVRNPWHPDHGPGGSSTGSAAAVGARLVPAALGTDTGGSIRRPAAWCGVTGFKPSYGRVSRQGALPLSPSLDHVGTVSRTAEDAALLLGAMAGHDPADPTTVKHAVPDYRAALARGIKGLRIGYARHFQDSSGPADPAIAAGMDEAVRVLRELGATVTEIALPPPQMARACFTPIMLAEVYAIHADRLRTRWNDYGSNTRRRFAVGAFVTGADYVHALQARRVIADRVEAQLRAHDLLLTVTAPTIAMRYNSATPDDLLKGAGLTSIFNISGHPAISVPAGFTPAGMPFGLQLAGRIFDEETLFAAAHAYERATNWAGRLPL